MILVLGLVVAGVVWTSGPPVERLAPGEVEVLDVPPWGRSATVATPGGDVEVILGAPVGRVDGRLVDGGGTTEDVVADGDDRLVAVSWRLAGLDTFTFLPFPSVPAAELTVTLELPGDEVELETVAAQGDASDWQHRVVGVAGEPAADEVAVAVTFDGVTQRVRATGEVERGVAEGLDDPTRLLAAGPCSLAGSGRLADSALACTVSPVVLLPYLAGEGWVDDADERFAAVSLAVDGLLGLDRAGVPPGFDAIGGELSVTLDGEPVLTSSGRFGEGDVDGTLVFRVRGTPQVLELSRSYEVVPEVGNGPRSTAVLTTRLPLSS